ncbi:hypothetical protein DSM106972_009220 [Dulcicalothrix desertica PCC 7102]|uniref:Virulence-associated protein E-like domain-containing protein n=1 Tax=Dulcicalothrix desertica PCC 7102 TaxID=232991 RepID=A0A433VS18_9CYAN|nr:virulence-associated E family protein [Dulcicalothrix desertica]RUT08869.1 hypothetical protein DSM106972_009220 [Dulcicalothrix desertica PCC 7102]TWH44115.1 putative P-loop ATPase and inactivated derivatives [Dulcicalothrix desertica PCC 7102]
MDISNNNVANYNSNVNAEIDFIDDTDTFSAGNDLDKLLKAIRCIDILHLQVLGSSRYDNKDAREQNAVIKQAKSAILKAGKQSGYVFWEVFKAAYHNKLDRNEWTGDIYFNGTVNTSEKLLDRLETSLGLLSPISETVYNRKLDVLLECYGFNPVRKQLENYAKQYPEVMPEWSQLASILFGTTDELSQMMVEKWLIAAVARAIQPGCQVDNALVLKGGQGIGKSTCFRILGGDYFLDLDNSTDGTEVKRQLGRSWIVEMGEMEAITGKKDTEELKAFLTKLKDTYRALYERSPKDHQRHVVFGGTCNSNEVLRDPTGSRRQWFIDCDERPINNDWLKVNREAILASAYHKFISGASWWADSEMTKASEERNKDYTVSGAWTEQLEAVLTEVTVDGSKEVAFKLVDIMKALLLSPESQSKNKKAILLSLKQLGYDQKVVRVGTSTAKMYCLKTASKPVPTEYSGTTWMYWRDAWKSSKEV